MRTTWKPCTDPAAQRRRLEGRLAACERRLAHREEHLANALLTTGGRRDYAFTYLDLEIRTLVRLRAKLLALLGEEVPSAT